MFARGLAPVRYSISAQRPFVRLSAREGLVKNEERVSVSINWDKVPSGKTRVPITITGPNGASVVVHAVIVNPASLKREDVTGFVEANGYVSMEAEHFTAAANSAQAGWMRIPDLGRTLSGMTITPPVAQSVMPSNNTPRLEYRVYLFTGGEISLHAYLSPTLNFRTEAGRKGHGLRYAVSIDDGLPQVIDMHAGTEVADWKYPQWWNQAVGDNIPVKSSRHRVDAPGDHVVKFWMVDPGIVLQKLVIDTGGMEESYLGPPESYRGEAGK